MKHMMPVSKNMPIAAVDDCDKCVKAYQAKGESYKDAVKKCESKGSCP